MEQLLLPLAPPLLGPADSEAAPTCSEAAALRVLVAGAAENWSGKKVNKKLRTIALVGFWADKHASKSKHCIDEKQNPPFLRSCMT